MTNVIKPRDPLKDSLRSGGYNRVLKNADFLAPPLEILNQKVCGSVYVFKVPQGIVMCSQVWESII